MKKVFRMIIVLLITLSLTLTILFLYLNRGLKHEIVPAQFTCLNLSEGHFQPFDTLPENIYGVGLSYAKHINETASEFDPSMDPPIFRKALESRTGHGSIVNIPSNQQIFNALEQLEPGISNKLNEFGNIPALLDYETELGLVLLEDIDFTRLDDKEYIPKVGFFMANDLGARSLAVLGEGQENRYDYWGISKSFAGFTPISDQMWIPNQFIANGLPCITIETLVNDELRQYQSTSDLIYTPLQMLQFIHRKYPNDSLKKGNLILTGTPGGVAMSTPRWLVRLAHLIGMDRFGLLKAASKKQNDPKFLKDGDRVIVRGEGLGSIEVFIKG